MTWSISIPYRDRSDPLPAVVDAIRTLREGDDRAIARQIVLRGMTSGVATAGALLDQLSTMSPSERRGLLDGARRRAGLPSLADLQREAARRTYAPPIGGLERDEAGCAFQVCAQPDCRNYPANPASGATMPHPAKRWWCSEHVAGHEADMEPWTLRVSFAAGGGLQFQDEVERDAEIAAVEAKRRADELEQRRAQRLAQLPEFEAERVARADQFRRATLPGAR
jgi:hypothetical protein